MELTTEELDEITEVQCNLDAFQLDEVIDRLRPEALIALRQECLDSIDRQNDILARLERRF
jgi:hypothetical protein